MHILTLLCINCSKPLRHVLNLCVCLVLWTLVNCILHFCVTLTHQNWSKTAAANFNYFRQNICFGSLPSCYCHARYKTRRHALVMLFWFRYIFIHCAHFIVNNFLDFSLASLLLLHDVRAPSLRSTCTLSILIFLSWKVFHPFNWRLCGWHITHFKKNTNIFFQLCMPFCTSEQIKQKPIPIKKSIFFFRLSSNWIFNIQPILWTIWNDASP